VTWNTPGYLPTGQAVVTGGNVVFQVGSSPTTFNTIYGYYMEVGSPAVLLFARAFSAPIVLSAAGQIIQVVPSYVTAIPS
jgi:hypothetical protein